VIENKSEKKERIKTMNYMDIILYIVVLASTVVNVSFFIYVLRKQRRYRIAFNKIGGFLLYNVIQLIFAIAMLGDSKNMEPDSIFLGLCLPIILITITVIPFKKLFDDIVEKESVDESYEFLLRKMETNQKFYIMMREYEEQLATLRHDFMNQVQVAYSVLENNENGEEGKILLDELNEKINQTRMPVFCNHRGVNIVLAMKHKEMEKLGIQVEAEVMVTEKIRIDESDLCFLIMNMLEETVELFALANVSDVENETENVSHTERKISLKIKNRDRQILIYISYPSFAIRKVEEVKKLKSNYQKYYEKTTERYHGVVYYDEAENEETLIALLDNIDLEAQEKC
jgi:hypothetical protein